MSDHDEDRTYTARFQLDGAVEVDAADPMAAAKAAWQVIRDWVLTGYSPVVDVRFDGAAATCTVDLESEEIR